MLGKRTWQIISCAKAPQHAENRAALPIFSLHGPRNYMIDKIRFRCCRFCRVHFTAAEVFAQPLCLVSEI